MGLEQETVSSLILMVDCFLGEMGVQAECAGDCWCVRAAGGRGGGVRFRSVGLDELLQKIEEAVFFHAGNILYRD